ncbi:MAG: DUF2459 domain-containing protein [Pseudomonadota bacterium]
MTTTRRDHRGAGPFLCVVIALALAACSSVSAPPPTADNCVPIRLWSNGWHTNFAFPAETLPADHPIRTLFPEATHFLVGWGEQDFYMAMGSSFWGGLKAIVPPSPSTLQIMAADEPVERRLWPGRDVIDVALSQEAAQRFSAALRDAVYTDEAGAPIVLGEARIPEAGLFIKAREQFHFFHMCNHWTAARLRDAGVPVSARVSFTAGGLMRAVERKTPDRCPSP